MTNPNPNDPSPRRDPFEELNRKIDAALTEIRPKVRRAMDELEQRVDDALQDLKPRVEEARTRARPRVDDFVSEVQPRIDSLLGRVQAALESLRRDLGTRASRAESRRSGETEAPWPEDADGAVKNNDPPKEAQPEWPTRDSRDDPATGPSTPGGDPGDPRGTM